MEVLQGACTAHDAGCQKRPALGRRQYYVSQQDGPGVSPLPLVGRTNTPWLLKPRTLRTLCFVSQHGAKGLHHPSSQHVIG
jgi:hypothetical protein